MRKLILVAALVLVSASAQAGGTRSLTLASSDQTATAQLPNAQQPNVAEAPQSVARPALRQRNGQRSQQGQRPQQSQDLQQSQGLQQSQDLQQSQGLQQGQRMRRPGPIAAAKYAVAVKVAELKRQGVSTLAHVRYALHRNGIYW
jgi:hypothetical protein